MCVSILFLQPLNDVVPLFRGVMAGEADNKHTGQSHFLVGHSPESLGGFVGLLQREASLV